MLRLPDSGTPNKNGYRLQGIAVWITLSGSVLIGLLLSGNPARLSDHVCIPVKKLFVRCLLK